MIDFLYIIILVSITLFANSRGGLFTNISSLSLIFGIITLIMLKTGGFDYAIAIPAFTVNQLRFILLLFSASLIITPLVEKHRLSLKIFPRRSLSHIQLKAIFSFFLTLFLVGTVICLKNVNFSFGYLYDLGRNHEQQFGSNRIAQQLFFLGPFVSCFGIFLWRYKLLAGVNAFLVTSISLLSSLFQGVKFTIADAVFIPFCFVLISSNLYSRISLKKLFAFHNFRLVTTIVALGTTVSYLFTFLQANARRGNNELVFVLNPFDVLHKIFSYIGPNYINLAYRSYFLPTSCFDLSIFIPRNIASEFFPFLNDIKGCLESSVFTGWEISEAYNMPTGIFAMYSFHIVMVIVAIPLLAFLYKLVLNTARQMMAEYCSPTLIYINFIAYYFCAYIMYSTFMIFFYWQFPKDKYIFLFSYLTSNILFFLL